MKSMLIDSRLVDSERSIGAAMVRLRPANLVPLQFKLKCNSVASLTDLLTRYLRFPALSNLT